MRSPRIAAPGQALSGVARLAGRFALWLAPVVLAVMAWHVLSVQGMLGDGFVAPTLERIWSSAGDLLATGVLLEGFRDTSARVVVAFALGTVVGVGLGILMGRVRLVRLGLRPVVSFLYPFPGIALYPMMLIIFGLGSASKIAVGFTASVFPILFATSAAASAVEPNLEWSARALGASRWGAFLRVVLPASLPGILTGMRIALVGAIVTVFIGEMVSAPSGLGRITSDGVSLLRISEMYVGIIAIALTGLVLDRALLLVRRQLLAWSPEGDIDVRAG